MRQNIGITLLVELLNTDLFWVRLGGQPTPPIVLLEHMFQSQALPS